MTEDLRNERAIGPIFGGRQGTWTTWTVTCSTSVKLVQSFQFKRLLCNEARGRRALLWLLAFSCIGKAVSGRGIAGYLLDANSQVLRCAGSLPRISCIKVVAAHHSCLSALLAPEKLEMCSRLHMYI